MLLKATHELCNLLIKLYSLFHTKNISIDNSNNFATGFINVYATLTKGNYLKTVDDLNGPESLYIIVSVSHVSARICYYFYFFKYNNQA